MKKFYALIVGLLFMGNAALATNLSDHQPTDSTSKEEIASQTSRNSLAEVKDLADKIDFKVKFGGYIMTKYDLTDQRYLNSNSAFSLRFVRLYASGSIFKDFAYKLQIELQGKPGTYKGPRVLDAFIEWQRFAEARIKIGEFKRSFGFENPMSPLVMGFGAFSQATNKLASISDRIGDEGTSGRDLGIQLQGDFFPAADGHRWLHYQVGIFNGQGINRAERNHHKDLIGGIWVSPIKNLRIGGFGWNGKYTNESYKGAGDLKYALRNRWGVGIDYEDEWVVRSEYMSSVGGIITDATAPDRADAWYAAVGAPLFKNFKLFGRWDCYRHNKHWNSLVANYGLSANYCFTKNFIFQLNYNFTNNRMAKDRYYNTIDFQVTAKF